MEKKETLKKAAELLGKELDTSERWVWMSFADPDLPKGSQFLGVIIIKSHGLIDATLKTHDLGLNPGGQIMLYELPDEKENKFYPEFTNRLLSKEEATKLSEEVF